MDADSKIKTRRGSGGAVSRRWSGGDALGKAVGMTVTARSDMMRTDRRQTLAGNMPALRGVKVAMKRAATRR